MVAFGPVAGWVAGAWLGGFCAGVGGVGDLAP